MKCPNCNKKLERRNSLVYNGGVYYCHRCKEFWKEIGKGLFVSKREKLFNDLSLVTIGELE